MLRHASRQLWQDRLGGVVRPLSLQQRSVGDACRALGVEVVEEFEGAEYSVDLAIPTARVAIEVWLAARHHTPFLVSVDSVSLCSL